MRKLIILLGVLGTSCSAIFVRVADASPSVLVFYRMIFCTILLCVPLFIWHREEWKKLSKKMLFSCVLSGIFLGFHFQLYFESLHHTSIASAVVFVDTEVFFVAIMGTLFLKEKLNRLGVISMLIAFAGSIIIAGADYGQGHLLGDALALLGALCGCFYTMLGRKLRADISTTLYTTIVYFTAGCVAIMTGVVRRTPILDIGIKDLGVALGLAVMCTLLGHSVFSWGLKYEKAAFISISKLMEPVFASILGVVLLAEQITLKTVLGGGVIIMGLILCIKSTENKKNECDNCAT